MAQRKEVKRCYRRKAERMTGDRIMPDRMTTMMQTLLNRGSNPMIRSSQSDVAMYLLNRRRSLLGLQGEINSGFRPVNCLDSVKVNVFMFTLLFKPWYSV